MVDHVAFIDSDITTANRVTAAWLNDVNDFIYDNYPAIPAIGTAFLQGGTGATGRTAQAKHRDIISVVDYGIVGNDSSSATRTANVAAALALFGPTADGGDTTRTGIIWFPNTTATTYYFNDPIPQRDGIILEGNGCGLDFTKAAYTGTDDDSMGFLYAMRDGAIRNFSLINVDYPGSAEKNSGSVIKIGNRGNEGIYFQNAYDSLYAKPSGNFTVQNVKLTSNNTNTSIVQMFGGLENVTFDHVTMDGQDLAYSGIDYEFGFWNSTGVAANDKSSHARNLIFRNIVGRNLDSAGQGMVIGLRMPYNAIIENVYADNVKTVIAVSTGEAANANPGDTDVTGVKRNIRISNVVGQGVTGDGISIGGITAWTGYLSPLATQTQTNVESKVTDLADYVVDGFAFAGTASGYGVVCSGGRVTLRNGRVTSFYYGVFDVGAHRLTLDGVDVYDSTSTGVNVTYSAPPYPGAWTDRVVRIVGGDYCGNANAISFNGPQIGTVENCTFGYDIPATGAFTVTGGTAGAANKLTSLTVNAVEILIGPGTDVLWTTSNTATAALIVTAINAYTATSGYTAVSSGAQVIIRAAEGTGTTPNGYVVVPTVGGDMTVGTIKDLSGGKLETAQESAVVLNLQSSTGAVTCRGNRVRYGTGASYRNITNAGPTNHVLENNTGDVDFTGAWQAPGSYTGTLTGCTTAPTYTVYYKQEGQRVEVNVAAMTATSNAVTKTITGSLPTHMRPSASAYFTCITSDNGGAYVVASGYMSTAGVINLFATAADGAFTNSGTFTSRQLSFSYQLG